MATLTVSIPENSLDILGKVIINAPLDKVFDAYVNKDTFTKWFCGKDKMTVKEFEGKDGGRWNVVGDHEGALYEFLGCFHEIAKNERIIWTFEYIGDLGRGHVSLEKMDFKALNESTTEMNSMSVFLTKEDRDGMAASGMEKGWRETIETLETLLTK